MSGVQELVAIGICPRPSDKEPRGCRATRGWVLASALLLVAGTPRLAAASVQLRFVTDNSVYSSAETYVTFGGAGAFSATLNGGAALAKGQSYSLDQLAAGVTLNEFNSGRIYLSLGQGLTSATSANGYAPNFANPSLPDYGTRWDKVELTYDPMTQRGGANLTAQDFFSVPLKLTTTGGASPATLTWRAGTAPVMAQLGVLSNFAPTQPPTGGFEPTGAVVTGAAGVSVTAPGFSGNVVRVISPATVTPKPDGTTVYSSFSAYILYLRNGGGAPIAANIAGSNGADASAIIQTYNLTATIANSAYAVAGASIMPGDVVFTGTVQYTDGRVVPTTAVIRAADLTDSGIYGASVRFTIVAGDDTRGVVTRAVADYLSGLNFGLVGSSQPNPNNSGHTIGESPSYTWYGNPPNGLPGPKLPIEDAFGRAQPDHPYYNPFAAALIGPTDAYGFPYNDRLQLPLASLDANTIFTITALSDLSFGAVAPVPEPGSAMLLATAGALMALLLGFSRAPQR